MERDKVKEEAKYLFSRLSASGIEDTDRAYWQGRIDGLAWAMKQDNMANIFIESESASR